MCVRVCAREREKEREKERERERDKERERCEVLIGVVSFPTLVCITQEQDTTD